MPDSHPLTAAALRRMISALPDDMPVEIFNQSSEWYGLERLDAGQLKVIDGRLVINFGGRWDMWADLECLAYRKERQKEADRAAAS